MANTQTAGFGLWASGTLGSTPATAGQGQYWIATNQATSIYQGEAVTISSGYVVGAQGSETATTVGVFNGCFFNAATTLKPTWSNYYYQVTPANSEETQAFVLDNPFQVYNVVTDAQVASTIAGWHAKIWETYGMNTSATSGTASGGRSSSTLKVSGGSNANTKSWRFLGSSEDPENQDVTAAYATVRVVQNQNELIRNT